MSECIDCKMIVRQAAQKKNKLNCKHRTYPKTRMLAYMNGAKRRNIEFDLEIEQFMSFWQKPCRYCNDPIETIGLDRVDSSKGYVLDNVLPCCKACNFMKGTMIQSDFIDRIHRISKYFGNW